MVSTVEQVDFAFFKHFAESLPLAVITLQTDKAQSPPAPKLESPAYAEVLEFCDERCRDFVQSWAEKGLPLPMNGYELQDEKDRICAQAEFAWVDKKVAALVPEEIARSKPAFEARGWTVFPALELAQHESQLQSLITE